MSLLIDNHSDLGHGELVPPTGSAAHEVPPYVSSDQPSSTHARLDARAAHKNLKMSPSGALRTPPEPGTENREPGTAKNGHTPRSRVRRSWSPRRAAAGPLWATMPLFRT